jgi:hypothetical protein
VVVKRFEADAVEQGDEADKVRAGKGTAALAAYPQCPTEAWLDQRYTGMRPSDVL